MVVINKFGLNIKMNSLNLHTYQPDILGDDYQQQRWSHLFEQLKAYL
ncbi:hypothetical protein GPS50_15470 [Acinetobacter haemolyticus]|nr:hypothetical protein [Acinetobacter haemolyticus]NAR81065.1 hypothetical protein [Acinetobacter haemolyticus]NAR97219.1 hypothetical protein [Acinetobacter haemolyticus]NAS03683.1 hypothetical protein [Acinetobacter haemolyticus]